MVSGQGMIRTAIALGIALTLGAPLTASAQAGQGAGPAGAPAGAQGGGGRGRGGPPPYTPAPGARDLRSVLHNWGWHLGMLRGEAEIDLVTSLEYKGTGTMQVDGQPCKLTAYRISTNYMTSGQRTQITCARPNGQTYSNIEVLNGAYAWNEDVPGAELIKGKGKRDSDGGCHRGADDSALGKSAGRAQVRAGGDPGSPDVFAQAKHSGARRCRNGR